MLESVSFFTAEEGVSYTVTIYDAFTSGQLSGELSSVSGVAACTGLHTVDLAAPVQLAEGDDFYVRLSLSSGGQPYDCTSDVPVLLGASYRTIVESRAEPGQSYYLDGASWVDLTSVDSTANFCIKALASASGLIVEGPSSMIFSGESPGRFDPSSYDLSLICMASSPIPYMVSLEPWVDWLDVTGVTSGILAPGAQEELQITLNSNAFLLEEGAYDAALIIEDISGTYSPDTLPILLLSGAGEVIYSWNMSSDPGWTTEGDWEYGVPMGMGGEHGYPDPTAGYSGESVYGYNLQGDYGDLMPEYSLTTGMIDLSGMHSVRLRFMRWLGVQENGFDVASVRVSTDGREWSPVWSNSSGAVTDSMWVCQELDISELADDSPEVYLRWTMGPTNMGWTYCGWNLDDVVITAVGERGSGGLVPPALLLHDAVPNPFSSATVISLSLPAAGNVNATVYDLQGRIAAVIADSDMIQGEHSLAWDGCDALGRRMPPGIYLLLVRTGLESARGKLMLLY
jgi:hypothetical protein